VSRIPRTALLWLVAALITAGAVFVIAGDDDDGGSPPQTSVEPSRSQTSVESTRSRPEPAPSGHRPRHDDWRQHPRSTRAAVREAVAESKSPRLDPDQREAAATVRQYVAALNARDGQRACALFVPGALARLDLPRDRGDCASSLSASVGYRDPRGTPVYERSRVARLPSVVIDGTAARVTATIVTRFADNREPSVEDDVVYLVRGDDRWLIAKPSITLYRAIGVGDIPPQALAPP